MISCIYLYVTLLFERVHALMYNTKNRKKYAVIATTIKVVNTKKPKFSIDFENMTVSVCVVHSKQRFKIWIFFLDRYIYMLNKGVCCYSEFHVVTQSSGNWVWSTSLVVTWPCSGVFIQREIDWRSALIRRCTGAYGGRPVHIYIYIHYRKSHEMRNHTTIKVHQTRRRQLCFCFENMTCMNL